MRRDIIGSIIKSFKDGDTQMLWETGKSTRIPANLRRVGLRNLLMLSAAVELRDLTVPPNNRLEAPEKDRKGQYSIRVNDQFRVCFVWKDGHTFDVEIVDYH